MEHELAFAVDAGIQRSNNEDTADALEIGWVDNNPASLAVLADGMGGCDAGEIASKVAVETLTHQIMKNWRSFGAGRSTCYWLAEAFKAANHKINDLNRRRLHEMGTTLVSALVIGSRAYVANIGDSRAYHITHGSILQITTDHSVVQGLLDAGMITPEQAKDHTLRNCITQALGTDDTIDVDLFQVDLYNDDLLLLCSDGLTNELNDEQILDIIQAADSPQMACENLIAAANDHGGHDNISAVLIQVKADGYSHSYSQLTRTLEMVGV